MKIWILMMIIMMETVNAYSLEGNNLNMTIYNSYKSVNKEENNLNFSMRIIDLDYFKEDNINISIPSFFWSQQEEATTTSIEVATGGGAPIALRTSRCPLNSHLSLDNGRCVCDKGYIFNNILDSCIPDIKEIRINKYIPISSYLLIIIILAGIFFTYITSSKEKRKKLKDTIDEDKIKEDIRKI